MPKRTDPLAELSALARIRKEREDAALIIRADNVRRRISSRAAIERDAELAGVPELRAATAGVSPLKPGENVDFVICARVDLDHPIYFADNSFCDCEDCGCRLQYRPYAPPGPRLCVCCAAQRVREDPEFGKNADA